jgi:hypothetical protein
VARVPAHRIDGRPAKPREGGENPGWRRACHGHRSPKPKTQHNARIRAGGGRIRYGATRMRDEDPTCQPYPLCKTVQTRRRFGRGPRRRKLGGDATKSPNRTVERMNRELLVWRRGALAHSTKASSSRGRVGPRRIMLPRINGK